MSHALNRSDVDLPTLAADLADRLGHPVALTARAPGQVDEDGNDLPGVLLVVDPTTGEELDVSGRTVAAAVRAHKPPPSASERRTQALQAAEAKANAGDTKGALADLFALLRADAPPAPGPRVTPTA